MNKMEIQSEIDNVNVELRSLMDDVKNVNKEVNLEEVRAKKAELEEKRGSLLKQLAECDRPVEGAKEEVRTGFAKLAEGMQKRATTVISGTGAVNAVKELVKAVQKRTDILNGARYFYGANATTKIPVWGSGVTAAFIGEGGSGTAPANQLGVTSVDPVEAFATLPVSEMALELSSADLAAELPQIFADANADLMADGMLNGKSITVGSDEVVCMKGIFNDTGATTYTAALTIANLAKLAVQVRAKKYANPVIVLSPSVYGLFMADTATDESTKLYKESIIRDKMIEDVKIVISGYAPTFTSASTGDIVAVAGDLSNYAIGVGGQLKIKAKDTAGSSVVTFDASAYFAGKPVISADFYRYTIGA